jgi:hypothetical protein
MSSLPSSSMKLFLIVLGKDLSDKGSISFLLHVEGVESVVWSTQRRTQGWSLLVENRTQGRSCVLKNKPTQGWSLLKKNETQGRSCVLKNKLTQGWSLLKKNETQGRSCVLQNKPIRAWFLSKDSGTQGWLCPLTKRHTQGWSPLQMIKGTPVWHPLEQGARLWSFPIKVIYWTQGWLCPLTKRHTQGWSPLQMIKGTQVWHPLEQGARLWSFPIKEIYWTQGWLCPLTNRHAQGWSPLTVAMIIGTLRSCDDINDDKQRITFNHKKYKKEPCAEKKYRLEIICTDSLFFGGISKDTFQLQSKANLFWSKFLNSVLLEICVRLLLNVCKSFSRLIYRQEHIYRKCKRIHLFLQRNIWLQHDFAVLVQRLHASSSLVNGKDILVLFITYHIQAFKIFLVLLRRYLPFPNLWEAMVALLTLQPTCIVSSSPFIGGGSNTFLFEEIAPYLNSDTHDTSTTYKFNTYILASQSKQLQFSGTKTSISDKQSSEPAICICNVPLDQLTHRLTVADMRMIADKHGIHAPSRVQRTELQTILNNHVCIECQPFVQVFNIIRQADQREAQLRATKKYQSKKGEEFVHSNLEAVKKYQLKKGAAFAESHLVSVKKYQSRKDDNFTVSHLASVKKYQSKKGEEFVASHLESVKTYQSKKGEEFVASNLESVKTYQSKKGEEFVASNLESVKTYQSKKGEEFVASNLESVKTYQSKKGEEFLAANLESVKTYQSKKGEEFVGSNLISVKEYQEKLGDKYMTVNLQSSRDYQDRQGPDYLKVNLKSARKYQEEKAHVYKIANLESSKKWQASQGEGHAFHVDPQTIANQQQTLPDLW